MSAVLHRVTAVTATFLLALGSVVALGVGGAAALPSGIVVVAGAVTPTFSGPTLTLTQTSDVAIITVSSFSVTVGESLIVVQPSASSTLVIRNIGVATAAIAGTVEATGTLVLLSPPGVLLAPTGSVDAGGDVVLSTGEATNADIFPNPVAVNIVTGPTAIEVRVDVGAEVRAGGSVGLVGAGFRIGGSLTAETGTAAVLSHAAVVYSPGQAVPFDPDGSPAVAGVPAEVGGTVTAGQRVFLSVGLGREISPEGQFVAPDVEVSGDINTLANFDAVALGAAGDPVTALGARMLVAGPVPFLSTLFTLSSEGGTVPTSSSVVASTVTALNVIETSIIQARCQVDAATGIAQSHVALGAPTFDGSAIVPGGYDFNVPNQPAIPLPGLGSVRFNEQVASTVGDAEVLTITAVVITPRVGAEVRIGVVSCGVPHPTAAALPATGADLSGGGFLAALAILLGGGLLYRRRSAA